MSFTPELVYVIKPLGAFMVALAVGFFLLLAAALLGLERTATQRVQA